MFNRFEIIIEFINEGHSGRYIQLDDFFVTNVIQILDQSPQAVTMSGDNNLFP